MLDSSEDAFFDLDDFDADEVEKGFLEENLQKIEDKYFGNPRHYTLFSVAANGSDTYWQNLGTKYGVRVKAFSFKDHGGKTTSRVVLSNEQLKQADEFLHKANKTLKRHFPTRNNFAINLLRCNWYQVKDSTSVFAIGKLSVSRSTVEGGTGWAVQMAIDSIKPVYLFDNVNSLWQQFEYDQRKFVYCKPPRLTLNFRGIGTRALPGNGKVAIEKIFVQTFGYLSRIRR